MKKILLGILFLGTLACSHTPVRPPASTEVNCMEKTTRKECFTTSKGEKICTCVPDDGEMYQGYP